MLLKEKQQEHLEAFKYSWESAAAVKLQAWHFINPTTWKVADILFYRVWDVDSLVLIKL